MCVINNFAINYNITIIITIIIIIINKQQVSGRMKCIGTTSHLKNRFSMGYQIEIRCLITYINQCLELCQEIFHEYNIDEIHGGYIRLKVDNNIDLASAFQILEQSKINYHIYDYSISQCTLEQVFIQFAKDQEEETSKVAGLYINSNNVVSSSPSTMYDIQPINEPFSI